MYASTFFHRDSILRMEVTERSKAKKKEMWIPSTRGPSSFFSLSSPFLFFFLFFLYTREENTGELSHHAQFSTTQPFFSRNASCNSLLLARCMASRELQDVEWRGEVPFRFVGCPAVPPSASWLPPFWVSRLPRSVAMFRERGEDSSSFIPSEERVGLGAPPPFCSPPAEACSA